VDALPARHPNFRREENVPTRGLLAARERIPFGSTQDGCRALGRSVSGDNPNWSQAGSKFPHRTDLIDSA
jgi:hypothetical protein